MKTPPGPLNELILKNLDFHCAFYDPATGTLWLTGAEVGRWYYWWSVTVPIPLLIGCFTLSIVHWANQSQTQSLNQIRLIIISIFYYTFWVSFAPFWMHLLLSCHRIITPACCVLISGFRFWPHIIFSVTEHLGMRWWIWHRPRWFVTIFYGTCPINYDFIASFLHSPLSFPLPHTR